MEKKIAIVLGSESDEEKLKAGFDLLDEFNISYQLKIISAHRNPDKLRRYCKKIEKEGYGLVIACAGLAAALPGFMASYLNIPVIGVGLKGGLADGLDSLFSIVSAPKGIGLVSSGIGKNGFINAIIFALEVLGLSSSESLARADKIKNKFK
ncbi:MAG: AIR carboxylase family protein [Candidatus Omnitrophica bacterium]|nr:AIR carboxylase family protein [Candidatus Omnitrophota bacterium]MCF7891735.1 AIR carboxylase family protein [Candidatus Omnitrophota bacterium]MCF7896229.1 AIR carboxylase family protein [Candidatus Omnitrophota bacterium]MCF7897522.1 AIR carboxylase family protein [Candidatus Omnitrophota bacterium]MCF7909085.1 AIR carboxylase family protein [Candidatus Omnitrophota bacterium]